MCGGILVRLVIDLWLRAPTPVATALVLRMLRAALASESAATRARAFDLVFNLAVHAALLSSSKGITDAGEACALLNSLWSAICRRRQPSPVCCACYAPA